MSWFGRKVARGNDGRDAGRLVTYADWSTWFDSFAKGGDDDRLLAQAAASQLNVSSATIDNVGRRALETLEHRLTGVGAMLQTGLRRIACEQDVVRAILNARSAFVLLRRYPELPCWPTAVRDALSGLIDHHVAERQKNLLRNAAEDRTGRLAIAIRNNPLDRHGPVPPRPSSPASGRTAATRVDEVRGDVSPRRRLLV